MTFSILITSGLVRSFANCSAPMLSCFSVFSASAVFFLLHKCQRAQSRERWRFAKQIQPDLDCGKKAVQWEGAVRQALPNGLGYFYRGTPAGFTT